MRNLAQTLFVGGTSGAITAAFLLEGIDPKFLESIDDFFTASLFLTLIAVSLTAGALLVGLAPSMLDGAYNKDRNRRSDEPSRLDAEKRSVENITSSGYTFIYAVYPAFLGLVAAVGVDGFLDSIEIQQGYAGLVSLSDINGDFGDELVEAIAGTAFLGSSLFLFFKGMLGLRYIEST